VYQYNRSPSTLFGALRKIEDKKFVYSIMKQKLDIIHALKIFFPKEKPQV
jgi:uncharacterized protein